MKRPPQIAVIVLCSMMILGPVSMLRGHGFGHGGHGHIGHGHFGHGHFGHGHGHFYGHDHLYLGAYYPLYSYGPGLSGNYYPDVPSVTAAPLPPNRARIEVIVPDPYAQVFFDGALTNSTGRIRSFDPPAMQPGVNYSYKVVARWTQNGQTIADAREVHVVSGRLSVVDFTRPEGEQLAPPRKWTN